MSKSIIPVLVLISLACLLTGGCGAKKDSRSAPDAKSAAKAPAAGLLYTVPTKGKSRVVWMDGQMNKTGEEEYDFSAAYYDGFRNQCKKDGIIYLFPRGDYENKTATKLVTIDLSNGKMKEYECGRANVTGYDAEGDEVLFTSNGDNTCYIDLMNLKTGRKKTTELNGRLWFDAVLADGEIYGMAMDDDLRISFERCDMSRGRCGKLMDLPDEDTPGFLQVYGREILFISDGKLVRYDTRSKHTRKIRLTRKDAYNLNLDGDTLWICYTDPLGSDDQKSILEARDLRDNRVLVQRELDGAVLQVETSGDEVWVLGYKRLTRYAFGDGELLEKGHLNTYMKGYDTGGFFLADRTYAGLSGQERQKIHEELVDKADRTEVVPDKK